MADDDDMGGSSAPAETSAAPRKRFLIINAAGNQKEVQDLSTLKLVTLPNGRNSSLTQQYGILNGQLYEIQITRNGRCGSWFCDNEVVESGALYILTPFDPLYLMIGILDAAQFRGNSQQQQAMYQPLYQILETASALKEVKKTFDLTQLCDTQDIGDEDDILYRISQTKTLAWLSAKHAQIKAALMQNESYKDKTVRKQDSQFRLSVKTPAKDSIAMATEEAAIAVHALKFIGEYVPSKWVTLLAQQLK